MLLKKSMKLVNTNAFSQTGKIRKEHTQLSRRIMSLSCTILKHLPWTWRKTESQRERLTWLLKSKRLLNSRPTVRELYKRELISSWLMKIKVRQKWARLGDKKTLKQKKDMDTNHSYDFGFPDELDDDSCTLSKTIVLTLMIITIIVLCMYLGGFFLTEAEKQELQDFADQ